MKRKAFFHIFLFLFCNNVLAQLGSAGPNDTIKVAVIKVNDSVLFPITYGEAVVVKAVLSPEKIAEFKKRRARLEYYIRAVYCDARKAAALVKEIRLAKDTIKKRKDKRQFVKMQERKIKDEFSNKIKNMYIEKGKVLVKLIYRETGTSAYEIIKEMKTGINARFWQTLIYFYEGNLKVKYDPQGIDYEMETIVKRVEKEIHCPYK